MKDKDCYERIKKMMLEAEQVDSGDFACIAIAGNKKSDDFISCMHASKEDMEHLLLRTMRENIVFTYCVTSALEILYEELKNNDKK